MKAGKARRQETFVDEIVETLRFVPKTRLRIRDLVGSACRACRSRCQRHEVKTRGAKKPSQNSILCGCGKTGRTSGMGDPMG
jgi:hypothetical protein